MKNIVFLWALLVGQVFGQASMVNGKGGGITDAAAFRTALSLQNVTNTSDVNKPVSTAQQTALDAKLTRRSYLCGPGTEFYLQRRRIESGLSTSAMLLGDSTFRDSVGLPFQFASLLATRYSTHRVELWRAANNMSGTTRTVVQAGPSGRQYRSFPAGTLWTPRMFPSEALVSFDGANVIRFEAEFSVGASGLTSGRINVTDWDIMGYGSGGSTKCTFKIYGTGQFLVSMPLSGGGSVVNYLANATIPLLTADVPLRLRADLIANNGSNGTGNFYYSTDEGVNWTQIGTQVTITSTTFGTEANATVWIGGAGVPLLTNTRIYFAQMYVGNPAVPIWPERIDLWKHQAGQTANISVLGGSPTIFIDQVAQDGGTMDTDGFFTGTGSEDFATEAYRCVRNHAPEYVIINAGHNDWTLSPAFVDTQYALCETKINARFSHKPAIVYTTQNPESTTYGPAAQAVQAQYATLRRAAKLGRTCVDVLHSFPNAGATYVVPADPHPTTTGYALWGTTTMDSWLHGVN